MKSKTFINGLKNGGITIVIIYFILNIILGLIDCILSGKNVIKAIMSNTDYNIPLNSLNTLIDTSGKLVAYSISTIVISLILTAGLYGSSKDIIEGKPANFSMFLQNSNIYYWRTLGYTFLYTLAFGIVIGIPFLIISYFASFSNFSFDNISSIVTILVTFIFQAIFIPIIILNVIDKETEGYIKKNYVIILIFSLISCALYLIPIVGQFFYLILNGFYPLLIISMYDRAETTANNRITVKDINNTD